MWGINDLDRIIHLGRPIHGDEWMHDSSRLGQFFQFPGGAPSHWVRIWYLICPCSWIIPNVLLAGGFPGSPEDDENEATLRGLLAAGVRTFVCLQEEYNRAATDVHRRAGLMCVCVAESKHPVTPRIPTRHIDGSPWGIALWAPFLQTIHASRGAIADRAG